MTAADVASWLLTGAFLAAASFRLVEGAITVRRRRRRHAADESACAAHRATMRCLAERRARFDVQVASAQNELMRRYLRDVREGDAWKEDT